jgi:FkbM family methyltransferase
VSYAQNGEDVVLWRALCSVPAGRYVEVGANHPTVDSISRAFYDRGWSGVAIEPVPALAAAYREARPRDIVVEAAVTSASVDDVVFHVIENSGLSTLSDDISAQHADAGWAVTDVRVRTRRLDAVLAEHLQDGDDIHFLIIDTEGAEGQVLDSIELTKWRPWVLVIEATAPQSTRPTHGEWEDTVLAAGYEYCMFDGLSRWYVAKERADLAPTLSYPACPLDEWVSNRTFGAEQHVHALNAELATCRSQNDALLDQVIRWRGVVLDRWAEAASTAAAYPGAGGVPSHETARLVAELDAMRRTLSWRVTAPLRDIRASQLRRSRRV